MVRGQSYHHQEIGIQTSDRRTLMSDWRIKWGLGFLLAALTVDLSHYLIFADSRYLLKFIVAQLGFLPISVFLVTIVLNQLLARREKRALIQKMNMVVGSFFSEVGTRLLTLIDPLAGKPALREQLLFTTQWSKSDYRAVRANLADHLAAPLPPAAGYAELRSFLLEKRDFLLLLLGNPNLLEHASFSELLWAVFHLAEELGCRANLEELSANDAAHLHGDVQRVSRLLLLEWLAYLQHLQEDYPYLFSLAVRTNPFDRKANAAIE